MEPFFMVWRVKQRCASKMCNDRSGIALSDHHTHSIAGKATLRSQEPPCSWMLFLLTSKNEKGKKSAHDGENDIMSHVLLVGRQQKLFELS